MTAGTMRKLGGIALCGAVAYLTGVLLRRAGVGDDLRLLAVIAVVLVVSTLLDMRNGR